MPHPHPSLCPGVGGPQSLGGWWQLVCLRFGGCDEQSLFGSRREEGRSRCHLHDAAGGEGALTPGETGGRQELVPGQEGKARWVAQHGVFIRLQGPGLPEEGAKRLPRRCHRPPSSGKGGKMTALCLVRGVEPRRKRGNAACSLLQNAGRDWEDAQSLELVLGVSLGASRVLPQFPLGARGVSWVVSWVRKRCFPSLWVFWHSRAQLFDGGFQPTWVRPRCCPPIARRPPRAQSGGQRRGCPLPAPHLRRQFPEKAASETTGMRWLSLAGGGRPHRASPQPPWAPDGSISLCMFSSPARSENNPPEADKI